MEGSSDHDGPTVPAQRRHRAVGVVIALGLLLCVGCSRTEDASSTGAPNPSSQDGSSLADAQSAAREVLGVIDDYGLRSKAPSWTDRRREFADDVDTAGTPEAILRALSSALRAGGGLHSHLVTVESGTPTPAVAPTVTVEGRLGVVSVPETSGLDADQEQEYATALDRGIQRARGRVCGWVVDLRSNTGGSLVPGFVGLSSLLPDGTVIGLVDRDGGAGSAYSLNGSTLTLTPGLWADVSDLADGGLPIPTVPTSPTITQPAAVLQSSSTASAAEATVVAFKGRPQTRFVGQPTFGVSSGNIGLIGPLDSTAYLTVGVFQDRTGVTYPETPISPDTVTAPGSELSAAKKWLDAQGCPGPA